MDIVDADARKELFLRQELITKVIDYTYTPVSLPSTLLMSSSGEFAINFAYPVDHHPCTRYRHLAITDTYLVASCHGLVSTTAQHVPVSTVDMEIALW